jgi:hypothetical protein
MSRKIAGPIFIVYVDAFYAHTGSLNGNVRHGSNICRWHAAAEENEQLKLQADRWFFQLTRFC